VDEVGQCLAALRDLSHGVHSDVLESIGLGAAVAARLAHEGSRARLTVAGEIATRPPDVAVAIAVERAVGAAVAAAPQIDAVDLAVVGDELVLSIDLGADVEADRPVPVDVPVDVLDVVGGGGGSVTADRARWVARFPLVPASTTVGRRHPGLGPAQHPDGALGAG
jgi:hypothetical protein